MGFGPLAGALLWLTKPEGDIVAVPRAWFPQRSVEWKGRSLTSCSPWFFVSVAAELRRQEAGDKDPGVLSGPGVLRRLGQRAEQGWPERQT